MNSVMRNHCLVSICKHSTWNRQRTIGKDCLYIDVKRSIHLHQTIKHQQHNNMGQYTHLLIVDWSLHYGIGLLVATGLNFVLYAL